MYIKAVICMDNISKEDLFRYFTGKSTGQEADRIDSWLAESDDHVRQYREASIEFELLVMNSEPVQSGCSHGHGDVAGRRRYFVRAFLWAAAAAACLFAAVFSVEWHLGRELEKKPVAVVVPSGQRMTLALSDGTTVELNSGSRLEYPALFRGRERNVHLEGEAVFHVARNEKKPFIVNTFAAEVEVLGTEFDVYADSGAGEFSTILIDGSVMVTGKGGNAGKVILVPDQKVSVKDGEFQVENVRASESVLWTEGIIDIADTDFRRLMSRMEKAYGVRIVIERDDIPEIDCTEGKVRISDGIDHALNILSQLSDFSYVRDTRTGDVHIR